jgi:parallel beta-helix repeat protein
VWLQRLRRSRPRRFDATLLALVVAGVGVAGFVPKSEKSATRQTAVPAPLPASTDSAFYVSPTGHDRAPGTLRRPWRTLGHAMAVLRPGQAAYVRAGTYVEGGRLNALWWGRSGTPSAPITIRGYPGEEARVVVNTRVELEGDYLRLGHLVVARNHAFSDFDHARTGDIGVWLAGKYDMLDHADVRGQNQSGVFVTGAYDQVVGSHVHDNGRHWNLDHGIYLGGENELVANNVIDRNYADGIAIWPACESCIVTSNTVAYNGRSGIFVGGPSSSTVVANNISAYNKEYGLRFFELSGTGIDLVANLAYANDDGAYCVDECGGGGTVSDALIGDPRFVAPPHDYRLQSGSPAIDAGISAYAPGTDLSGKPRSQYAAPDLGAFEH